MKKLDLSRIHQVDFPGNQYFKEIIGKLQVVLHHSAGWDNARGMFAGWARDKTRVATCTGISDKGDIYQAFWSKYWAYHLGVSSEFLRARGFKDFETRWKLLNQQSIGVEICNWGWLKEKGGRYYAWPGYDKKYEVPKERVQVYETAFRGKHFFEKYTDAEIESLRQLLVFWNEAYGIPLNYKEDMWDVSDAALGSEAGIWAHVSYRPANEKWDAHPQPELIQMLKSLAA